MKWVKMITFLAICQLKFFGGHVHMSKIILVVVNTVHFKYMLVINVLRWL
jgi:hypothetical protein